MRISAVFSAALGALAIVAAGDAVPQPSKAYGCACLHNSKIDTTVNFRYRWGGGAHKSNALAKGQVYTVCWAYKDAPKSPDLEFQLDVDLTGKTEWKTFPLTRGQSASVSCEAVPSAAHYHFGYVANSSNKKIKIYPGKS
jgi:hypothetical protein